VHVKLLKLVLGLNEGCLKVGPLFIPLMLSHLATESDGELSSLIDRLLLGGVVNSDWSSLIGGLFVREPLDFKWEVFTNLKERSFSRVFVEGEQSESD
jgi:hypothetical protein